MSLRSTALSGTMTTSTWSTSSSAAVSIRSDEIEVELLGRQTNSK
jgi:hypothetical protein